MRCCAQLCSLYRTRFDQSVCTHRLWNVETRYPTGSLSAAVKEDNERRSDLSERVLGQ